jgi:hypothetical protein
MVMIMEMRNTGRTEDEGRTKEQRKEKEKEEMKEKRHENALMDEEN